MRESSNNGCPCPDGNPEPTPEDIARNEYEDILEGLPTLFGTGRSCCFTDLPAELRGVRPPGLPYTPWRLVEHLRIAQWDILRFCVDPTHVSPAFPDGYWPEGSAPPDADAWDHSVAAFRADLRTMMDLVADPSTELFAPIPHGQGQTVLREDTPVYRGMADKVRHLVNVEEAD